MKYFFILIIASTYAHAWDTTFKTDFNHTSTSNVDSSNTAAVADTYNTLTGTLQTKDEKNRWRLKGKYDKYQKTTANDNYTVTIGYQYKFSKEQDLTFDVFKQKYKNVTAITNSDTAYDNVGGKLSTTFTNTISSDQTSYITLMGTFKNYSPSTRKDKIVDATFGYENYISKSFSLAPELNVEYNNSGNSYYSNFNIGPSLALNFTTSEDFEIFANIYLTYTSYSSRTFTTQVKNKTVTNKEHSTLVTSEIGAIYNLFGHVPLTAKYSTNNNSSNNPTGSYKANNFSFNIGFKF